jgi:CheY-like chemotaxis protein
MTILGSMMTLPAPASGPAERKALHLRAANGGRPRLLLAEDSDPVRIVTAAMLKAMGCDVEAVIHGEHAVKSASENRFDVIVLDIEMPVMDGITAAKSIRRLGGTSSGTPLMALSAFLADSVRAGHWRDTFDIALPKPANRNELHGAVNTALMWQQVSDDATELPSLLDAAALLQLRCGITAGVWRQLADVACRDIEICINQISHAGSGRNDGAILTFAAKLADIGRTFAGTRMVWAAERVRNAPSEAARNDAILNLVATARETIGGLRAS